MMHWSFKDLPILFGICCTSGSSLREAAIQRQVGASSQFSSERGQEENRRHICSRSRKLGSTPGAIEKWSSFCLRKKNSFYPLVSRSMGRLHDEFSRWNHSRLQKMWSNQWYEWKTKPHSLGARLSKLSSSSKRLCATGRSIEEDKENQSLLQRIKVLVSQTLRRSTFSIRCSEMCEQVRRTPWLGSEK